MKNRYNCHGRDLNPGPLALESNAQPTELSRLSGRMG